MESAGRLIIIIGLILVLAGLLLSFLPGNFRWLGKLPGDIRYEEKNFKIYIPFTTMLLVSIVISFLLYIIRRLF